MSATATVKGGFWPEMGISSLTQVQGRSPNLRTAAMLLGRREMRALRELAITLNGAVAGSAASATIARVEANSELGGKRVIETETLVGRNTAAADVTELNNYLFRFSTARTFGASPVANLDGNPLGTR